VSWIFDRVTGRGEAVTTPIGNLPAPGAVDLRGLDVSSEDMATLLSIDVAGWKAEVPLIREYFAKFGDRLPAELASQVDALEERLS
jgi:phosphoenolpyruvate carboxykinase (GTP)